MSAMLAINFYVRTLQDTEAPRLTLQLEAGRASRDGVEYFCLGDGIRRVLLGRAVAAEFMKALRNMTLYIQRGRLEEKVFYAGSLEDSDGGRLGVDLGVKIGRPFIQLEDSRVNVSFADLEQFNAACSSVSYLAGNVGIAGKLAQAQPGPRPWWEGYGRSLDPTPLGSAWYDD